jgi:hypothetical protein
VRLAAGVVGFLAFAVLAWALAPVEFVVGRFSFERPADWKWEVPGSSMRKAQLSVPGGEAGPADVVFFHFGPGEGGGLQANVDRWFAQFGNSNTAQREVAVGETRIVFVEAEGTFQSGMPGGPTTPLDNHALRGAIIEDAEGGDVFVKMTGPAAVVRDAALRFDEMVRAAAMNPSPTSAP